MKHLYLLLTFVAIVACSSHRDQTTEQQDSSVDFGGEESYPDGTYCAEVQYYYPETGTRSTYTLTIDIEDGDLARIHWPNGGWLDSSHFSTPDISDGSAEFTSEKGVQYTVEILGKDGECSLSTYADAEDDLIRERDRQQEEEEQQQAGYERQQQEEEEQRQADYERQQREEEEQQRRQAETEESTEL